MAHFLIHGEMQMHFLDSLARTIKDEPNDAADAIDFGDDT